MPQKNIKNQKDSSRIALLRALSLPKDTRAVVLLLIEDHELVAFLSHACGSIGVYATSRTDEIVIAGADIFVADASTKSNLISSLLNHAVVGVVSDDIAKDIFRDFNPMKFEGNAFIYTSQNSFGVFESIVRALENMKYPGDRHTLLKNVVETKV